MKTEDIKENIKKLDDKGKKDYLIDIDTKYIKLNNNYRKLLNKETKPSKNFIDYSEYICNFDKDKSLHYSNRTKN